MLRMILLKTRHALHFCLNQTEMKPGVFRGGPMAQSIPVFTDHILIQLGNLAHYKLKTPDAPRMGLTRFLEGAIQDGLNEMEFAHGVFE